MLELFAKMQWLSVFMLATAVCSGGGVTKPSGIEQFWTDDFKVFEQVYGKISDKEIYGATLPPNIGFADEKNQASEKKERFINYQTDLLQNSDEFDTYAFGNKKKTTKQKKRKPSFNFIPTTDFKPISQSSDPETYNYLKHLEENVKNKKAVSGFKPYVPYGPNPEIPEETNAYKSIQEILDAHEANKGTGNDEDSKYLTYRENKKPPQRKAKPRYVPGRSRKPGPVKHSSYRSRTRPYYRTIKKIIKY